MTKIAQEVGLCNPWVLPHTRCCKRVRGRSDGFLSILDLSNRDGSDSLSEVTQFLLKQNNPQNILICRPEGLLMKPQQLLGSAGLHGNQRSICRETCRKNRRKARGRSRKGPNSVPSTLQDRPRTHCHLHRTRRVH